MRWYVSRAGATEGPLEEEAVRSLARANRLDGCQVRDEAGGAWVAAKASPFGSLMKERGIVGPAVAGLAVMVIARFVTGGLFETMMGGYPNASAQAAWVSAALAGLLTFGLLTLLRRL